MKQLYTAMTLSVSITLSGAVGADDAPSPSPQTNPPAPVTTDGSTDWSKTRLDPQPELRAQLARAKAYLEENESEVDEEIDRLKTDGRLDRRSTSAIRSALDSARDTMTGMTGMDEGVSADEQIDGWTARMIAYELGKAADDLEQQADQLAAEPGEASVGGDHPADNPSSDAEKQRQLAQTLRTTSNMLRSTAHAIVRNLK